MSNHWKYPPRKYGYRDRYTRSGGSTSWLWLVLVGIVAAFFGLGVM